MKLLMVNIYRVFQTLHLSLVFICRENPRQSGILLFLDRPWLCRLMKFEIADIPDRPEIGSVSIFPTRPRFLRWSAIIPQMICTVGDVGVLRWWSSLIANPLNCWVPVPLSQINVSPLENLGPLTLLYFTSRQWILNGWNRNTKLIFWQQSSECKIIVQLMLILIWLECTFESTALCEEVLH